MNIDNKGMSLVEVLAGFLLLVVVMTGFTKIIQLSSKLTTISADTKKNNLDFEKKYYEGTNYQVDYKSGNTTIKKYAFRENGSNVINGYGKGNIFIAECKLNNEGSDFEKRNTETNIWSFDPSEKMILSNVELIQIENLYDANIARQKVLRYYIDE